MGKAPRLDFHSLWGPLLLGIAYYCLAAVSLYLTKGADSIASLWPSSGLILGALAIAPVRRRVNYIAAGIVASFASNYLAGNPASMSAIYTLANMSEAVLAIWLLRVSDHNRLSFVDPAHVIRFCGVAIIASFWSASFASIFTGAAFGFFLSWWTTVMLGIAIVTPIMVTLFNLLSAKVTRTERGVSHFSLVAYLTAVAAVTILVFSQNRYPLLFLPPVAVLAATFRLGSFGAAASVLIVAVIGSYYTSEGTGPVHFVDGPFKENVLFLQFYLAVMLATAMPFAALITTRAKLMRQLDSSNKLLQQAEAAAKIGHWRLHLVKETLFWSPEMFNIFGRSEDTPPPIEQGLDAYHAEDRKRVAAVLQHTIENCEPFDLEARIVRGDGSIRHVHSVGEAESDRSGKTIAIFGTVQDVTSRIITEKSLEQAWHAANQAADAARLVANTDALTGLPNRRRTMEVLEKEIACATENGTALSIAIFDVDHFKSINDTHGHATGDDALKFVSDTVSSLLREQDLVGRVGGEEFIVILPGTEAKQAIAVSERIRTAIETKSAAHSECPAMTVSIGVDIWKPRISPETLLSRADRALYDAKNSGRNTLKLAA